MTEVKTKSIYETESLEVSAKGDTLAIEVLEGHWHATTLDRGQARNLAAQILAWCAAEPDGGSAF